MSSELLIVDSDPKADNQDLVVRDNLQVSTQLRGAGAANMDDDLIDTGRIWRVILRYRKLIAISAVLFAGIAFMYSLFLRPEYTATATLRFNQNTSIANVGAGDIALSGGSGSSWKANPTTLALLKGRAVGANAIESVNLQADPEFTGELKQRSLLLNPSKIISLFSFTEPQKTTNSIATNYGVSRFQSKVLVEEVEQTDLIKVSYTSFNPQKAMAIANQIGHSLNALEKEKQQDVSAETVAVLTGELSKIQEKLLLSERKMTEFARKTGVVDLESRDNILNARQVSGQKNLLKVQEERLALESKLLKILNTKNPKKLAQFVSNEEIAILNNDLLVLKREQQKLSAVFQPTYPKLRLIESQKASIERAIRDEVDKARELVFLKYEELLVHEQGLLDRLDLGKNEMFDLKDRSVAFNILKREWETNKKLYEGMLEKVKLASLASNLETSRISISELALAGGKTSPNIPKNTITGFSGGLFLGLALAFIFALRDRRFRTIKEVEDHANAPVLAVIPMVDSDQLDAVETMDRQFVSKLSWTKPSSQTAEIFRSLRTSLMYSLPGQEMNMIMVTSSGPGEGKSMSIINLATTFARNNKRVVVVDFDLRKPTVHKVFGLPRAPGVTDSLVDGLASVRKTEIENLSVVTAGSESPNPTEMIESHRCKDLIKSLKENFDVVLFDAPPVMGLADSLVLTQHANFLVMAVDISQTNKDALKASLNRLRRVNAPLVGLLVTRYSNVGVDKYRYDDYQDYNYHYQYGLSEEGKKTDSVADDELGKKNKYKVMRKLKETLGPRKENKNNSDDGLG